MNPIVSISGTSRRDNYTSRALGNQNRPRDPHRPINTASYTSVGQASRQQGISQGWPAILSSLKSLLETGDALDYPWKG